MMSMGKKPVWNDDQAAAISLAGCGIFIFGVIALIALWPNAALDIENARFDTADQGVFMMGAALVSLVAFGGSVFWLGVRRHPYGWRAVGLQRTSASWLALSVVLGVCFVPISLTLTSAIGALLDMPVDVTGGEPVFDSVPVADFLLAFVGTALIVPFAEEIFFRGMLYQWIGTRTNLWLGLLISSAVFGAVHFSAVSWLSLTLAGVLCAVVYTYSGSIWNATALHAANNGTVVIVSYFILRTPVF
ncbi:MAG: CPBP family intramembrane metalloprotease [Anaerolineaceae bacterium]|nr:MAG: CPBP family intramembrane metalloprotease [Anaerolineaceae bacterium]